LGGGTFGVAGEDAGVARPAIVVRSATEGGRVAAGVG
jgi:hypothetical protein